MKVNGQWVPCVHNSSYSFMPIALKLYMCYGHGMKICMWFGSNPLIFVFCLFFHNLNLVIFSGIFSEWIEGTLRNTSYSLIPILLKLKSHHDHALKVCIWFGYNPPIKFCYFFSQFELSHFSGILTMKVNGQWIPCVRNSSYSLIQILLKLYRHCDHA